MSRLNRPSRGLSDDLLAQAHEWADVAETPITDEGTWTIADIRGAARAANARVRIPASSLRDDPVRIAESAIGYAIAVDPYISWSDAVAAGQREIWDTAMHVREDAGLSSRGKKPHFAVYWLDYHIADGRMPHVTRCENRMALDAVLRDLPERHMDTLLVAAFTDTTDEAAEAVGVTPATWRQRVRVAREAALELWFDGETPPPLKRLPVNRRTRERTCPAGHLIVGDNVETNWQEGRFVERCKTCRAAQKRDRRERAVA